MMMIGLFRRWQRPLNRLLLLSALLLSALQLAVLQQFEILAIVVGTAFLQPVPPAGSISCQFLPVRWAYAELVQVMLHYVVPAGTWATDAMFSVHRFTGQDSFRVYDTIAQIGYNKQQEKTASLS